VGSIRRWFGAAKPNLLGLIESARPVLLLKVLALMLLGATYALNDLPDMSRLVRGFLIVGPLLWSGLYILNDVTDVEADRLHPIKKHRPLPAGRSSPRLFGIVAAAMIMSAAILSWNVNGWFFSCVLLMIVKQGLYTLPPFRFKERFCIDILFGSVFNSTLRFLTGWFLFSTRFDFPLLLLVSCEGLQVSGFMVNRLYSNYTTDLERALGYSSTLVKIPTKAFKLVAVLLAGVGVVSFLFLPLNSVLHIKPQQLGCLPLQSLTAFAALVIATPLFLFPSLKRANSFTSRDLRRYNDLPIYLILITSVYISAIIELYGT